MGCCERRCLFGLGLSSICTQKYGRRGSRRNGRSRKEKGDGQRQKMNTRTMTYKSYSLRESKHRLQAAAAIHTYFVQILAAHIIWMKMEYYSCRTQRGTHNQIKTLQDTLQINRFSDFTVYSRFRSHWKPGRNLSFPLQHCRCFFL